MSRLDSVIRRLAAQRACLEAAARLIAELPGPVLEVGLGNGRTFDHLREILPGREIFALDRRIAAHPDCLPDAAHTVVGDFRDTVPGLAGRLGGPAALAHCDTGSGDKTASLALAAWLGPALDPALAQAAVVASDQPMTVPGWQVVALPEGVAQERYFLYRKGSFC
ncbi:MAG TPA: class I SAM-dependent methyltransferase [Alphaproteobacteria bacterium]|jgi:hypothetical protein|nr:class I SAM-dependent methyltransferase [Alphaproteobacteria bacterium]HJM48449.1 class I SAM-dependent methyltransferase [Alphaproteobacteria bacterium]|tara:strand:- start:133 stop:630 length:498 start_codon:yes stop_codon:yes gene_type:complete